MGVDFRFFMAVHICWWVSVNGPQNEHGELWVFREMEVVVTDASRLMAMVVATDSRRHLPEIA